MKKTDQKEKRGGIYPVNVAEWAQMYTLREQNADIQPFYPGAAEELIDRCIRPNTAEYLARIHAKPEVTKKLLRVVKDLAMKETVDQDPPRPFICGRVLTDQVLSSTIALAKLRYAKGDDVSFVFWYDVAAGIMETSGCLFSALLAIRGLTDQRLRQANAFHRVYVPSIPAYVQQITERKVRVEVGCHPECCVKGR